MRVLIDTSYAARGRSGTAVYIERLVAALRARGEVEVVEASQPRRLRPGRAGRVRNPLRSAANAVADDAWLHRGLPQAAREAEADVVHHPLPAHAPRIAVPQVATIHDVAFLRLPGTAGPVWSRIASRRYRAAAARCQALVCVSEASASDAVELLSAPRGRIVVAPHGPGQELPPVERVAAPRHFLYVGDAEPRKGIGRLQEAHRAYATSAGEPLPLVLAGAAGPEEVSPAELAELLAEAAALVHPSAQEGFGLTLMEAMAAGTPVVAVRNPGVAEVCGQAALLVEAEDLAAAMGRVGSDAGLRERLSVAGRERAASFSWEKSARLHERAYTLAAEARTEAS